MDNDPNTCPADDRNVACLPESHGCHHHPLVVASILSKTQPVQLSPLQSCLLLIVSRLMPSYFNGKVHVTMSA